MTVQEKIDRVRESHNNMYREALIANEKLMTLEQLSGYSIDTLISLFAEGFKLTAPPPGQKLGDLFAKENKNERE